MNSAALYKSLTEAGASRESATAATEELGNRLRGIEAAIAELQAEVADLKIAVAELKVTNRITLGLVCALFLLMLKSNFL